MKSSKDETGESLAGNCFATKSTDDLLSGAV